MMAKIIRIDQNRYVGTPLEDFVEGNFLSDSPWKMLIVESYDENSHRCITALSKFASLLSEYKYEIRHEEGNVTKVTKISRERIEDESQLKKLSAALENL